MSGLEFEQTRGHHGAAVLPRPIYVGPGRFGGNRSLKNHWNLRGVGPSGFLSSKTSGQSLVRCCEAKTHYFVINHLKGLETKLSLPLISKPIVWNSM